MNWNSSACLLLLDFQSWDLCPAASLTALRLQHSLPSLGLRYQQLPLLCWLLSSHSWKPAVIPGENPKKPEEAPRRRAPGTARHVGLSSYKPFLHLLIWSTWLIDKWVKKRHAIQAKQTPALWTNNHCYFKPLNWLCFVRQKLAPVMLWEGICSSKRWN